MKSPDSSIMVCLKSFIVLSLNYTVCFSIEWSRRYIGKYILYRQCKKLADTQSEFETGIILPALQDDDRLVTNIQRFSKVLARHAPFRTQSGQALIDSNFRHTILDFISSQGNMHIYPAKGQSAEPDQLDVGGTS